MLSEEIAFLLSAILELICFVFGSYNAEVFTWIMVINGIFMTCLGFYIIYQEEQTR